jgi:hypothetical protein
MQRVGAVSGNQSFSGSTGIGAFFGEADAGGGAAVMTSEFICALLSGVVAAGFTVVVSLATGGVIAGAAGVTTLGSVLMPAGGKAGGKGVVAG